MIDANDELKNKKYNNFYMSIAEQVAQMSYAVRLKVGSILVKDNNIISFGWNGTPSGWDNNCEYKDYCIARDFTGEYFPGTDADYPFEDTIGRYRLKTKPEVLHSEANCLMKIAKSTISSDSAIMYCTHAPCIDCSKLIYQSKIKKLYYRQQYRDDSGLNFLKRGGISIEQFTDS